MHVKRAAIKHLLARRRVLYVAQVDTGQRPAKLHQAHAVHVKRAAIKVTRDRLAALLVKQEKYNRPLVNLLVVLVLRASTHLLRLSAQTVCLESMLLELEIQYAHRVQMVMRSLAQELVAVINAQQVSTPETIVYAQIVLLVDIQRQVWKCV